MNKQGVRDIEQLRKKFGVDGPTVILKLLRNNMTDGRTQELLWLMESIVNTVIHEYDSKGKK